jgi:Ala-tRNA(Pro) deacylase
MSDSEDRLYADLAALAIAWQLVEHEAVFTVEESAKLDRDLPGAHTKNLFLKDGAGQFWLVTVPSHIRVDLKQLPAAIGSKRLSFGKAEDMVRLLDVTPGSVTPLAAMNDAGGAVRVVLDSRLTHAERINVHPLRNTATLGMASADLVRVLQHWNHGPAIADIPTLDAA